MTVILRSNKTVSGDDAYGAGFPFFMGNSSESSPSNSSPYHISQNRLRHFFENDVVRAALLDNLILILDKFENIGFNIPLVLIGGGFVRRISDGSVPKDIDCVALYSVRDGNVDVAINLRELVIEAKALNIDLRFCPIDGDLAVTVKSLVFYSLLFCISKSSMIVENGLILVDRMNE